MANNNNNGHGQPDRMFWKGEESDGAEEAK